MLSCKQAATARNDMDGQAMAAGDERGSNRAHRTLVSCASLHEQGALSHTRPNAVTGAGVAALNLRPMLVLVVHNTDARRQRRRGSEEPRPADYKSWAGRRCSTIPHLEDSRWRISECEMLLAPDVRDEVYSWNRSSVRRHKKRPKDLDKRRHLGLHIFAAPEKGLTEALVHGARIWSIRRGLTLSCWVETHRRYLAALSV